MGIRNPGETVRAWNRARLAKQYRREGIVFKRRKPIRISDYTIGTIAKLRIEGFCTSR